MNVHASLRHLHMSPRKVRLVADSIRGLTALDAERQLLFHQKWASRPLLKLLRSAMANAKHNFHIEHSALRIAKITVDQGPTLKRYRPRAFGSAAEIRKRTSHIVIVLHAPTPSSKQKKPALQPVDGPTKAEKKREPARAEKDKKLTTRAKKKSLFRKTS